ncbi:MAG: hypothetical protein HQ513_18450 [Rhodospirillales bacterium]|nr:hypothetical protein [Rhodospirillales bacterium]
MNEIEIDAAFEITDKRRLINKIDIRDAVFVRNGSVIKVPANVRDDFRFTGLSTIDFVLSHFDR